MKGNSYFAYLLWVRSCGSIILVVVHSSGTSFLAQQEKAVASMQICGIQLYIKGLNYNLVKTSLVGELV